MSFNSLRISSLKLRFGTKVEAMGTIKCLERSSHPAQSQSILSASLWTSLRKSAWWPKSNQWRFSFFQPLKSLSSWPRPIFLSLAAQHAMTIRAGSGFTTHETLNCWKESLARASLTSRRESTPKCASILAWQIRFGTLARLQRTYSIWTLW